MNLIHERTYAEHYTLDAVVERFYDSFPIEWGELIDINTERFSSLEDICEETTKMENGLEVKVEIFLDIDADDGEPWVCKAYKIY
ncbi:hypothetical protein BKK42_07400 [Bacillus cereus]|nr:hypothetical protein BKK43_03895 [Bacillus cereus]ONG85863.1 hypothetical protein BKK42_07400 [Bacillus cereus]PEF57736.1 hypothetical protein CON32_11490 [Bacillus cereus]